MNCQSCHKKTNTREIENEYFAGRNSAGIPFFKCEHCGNLFYINEKERTTHSISRGEKGSRFVPIILGLIEWLIGVAIFYFFGNNIITWIIGGILLWLGWADIKIGIWGSQKLIDEMTLDRGVASSKKAIKEYRKITKI